MESHAASMDLKNNSPRLSASARESSLNFRSNLQILANAGSGKTHTLVTRIIRLLMMGVPPRRIIALTFTRKAAGEFLTKLLQRLAAAALDERQANELSSAIGLERSSAEYRTLLREVVENLGKLQLTTLDSFFNRIVSAFPQELGLSAPPSLLDTHAGELAGRESLQHALGKLSGEEINLLLQALLERDEGSASSSVGRELQSFRREVHEPFLDFPMTEAWGNSEPIWGVQENPWKRLSPADVALCREAVALETGKPVFPERVQKSWDQLQVLTRGVKPLVVVKEILSSLDSWKQGTGSFTFLKVQYEVTPQGQGAAAALAEHYLHESTEYRLREARAVHHLLSLYEKEYDAEVRTRGLLTFSDVTRLLQPDREVGEPGSSEGFLGMGRASPGTHSHHRLLLDERLDALFDHWLLDEFQDTSRSQYRALENILDEVISEAARGGERSFFCVGDIKQAIYGWRNGDARLFDEIHNRYSQGSGGLFRDQLALSWRSSAEILTILNALFGTLQTTAPTLPESVRERWQRAWAQHQPAPLKEALPGYFSWETSDDPEDTEEKVASLLRDMQPHLNRGMTIALLVRSGEEAREWLETLRFAGIEALSESNPPVGRDNPVAAAVRSAISLLAHPGDSFARNHLSMEPLRPVFSPQDNPSQSLDLLIRRGGELHAEGGFTALVDWLLEQLAPLIRDDFSRNRAASLRRAAIKADASGVLNHDDFLTLLEDYEEQGNSSPGAVQVMTIHKAKGLEYDMVVLPLSTRQKTLDSLDNKHIDLWRNPRGEPFLMKLPAEEVRDVPGNETFASAAEQKREDRAFEELCVWYVAMSRAKRALHLFSAKPKKLEKKKCPNFLQLLSAGLENLSSDQPVVLGDARWYEHFQQPPVEPPSDPLPQTINVSTRPAALGTFRPSDESHRNLTGSQAFQEMNPSQLGTETHALFESLEWISKDKEFPFLIPKSASREARELMDFSLRNPAIRTLFQKPDGPADLWREQRFDLVLEGRWVSGCFDRVVIYRDAHGRPTHADLIDFKTDQGSRDQLIASYRSQMEIYRRALSLLSNLPQEKIRRILLHLLSPEPVVIMG